MTTIADVIAKIREKELEIEVIEKRHKEELKPLVDWCIDARRAALAYLNRIGTDSVKTPVGTAYKKEYRSYRVKDVGEFQTFVIDNQEWGLLKWAANPTNAENWFQSNELQEPPGLERSVELRIHILAPRKPRAKKPAEGLSAEAWAELEKEMEEEMKAEEAQENGQEAAE